MKVLKNGEKLVHATYGDDSSKRQGLSMRKKSMLDFINTFKEIDNFTTEMVELVEEEVKMIEKSILELSWLSFHFHIQMLKTHTVSFHLLPFAKKWKFLGLHSEQAIKSMHAKFNQMEAIYRNQKSAKEKYVKIFIYRTIKERSNCWQKENCLSIMSD